MAARLTALDRVYRSISEKAWQQQVEALLRLYGWKFYHAPDNRPGRNGAIQNIRAGFPDLIAIRGQRTLAIELKRELGKTTEDQDAWLATMAAAGWETYVWRPSDLENVGPVLRPEWTT
jgi:hypothetical protein